MSTSDVMSKLTANASDRTVEISLIDGTFARVASALGRLEKEVLPGLYKVKFKAGSSITERDVFVEPGRPVSITEEPIRFASTAPIQDTTTSHEYHGEAAQRLSQKIHVAAGAGSQIFVFVRDFLGRAVTEPGTGLRLLRLDGTELSSLATLGESSSASQLDMEQDAWWGCTIAIDPGIYRLALEIPDVGQIEQAIVASPGWQTQVFLLREQFGRTDRWLPALGSASILLAPHGRGFDPNREDMRWTELARQGVERSRAVMPADLMEDMLWAKFENPMLGILGAHLMLLDEKPDLGLLRTVIVNLAAMLGDHPDVRALALALGTRGISVGGNFDSPPMLRRSWDLVIRASAQAPDVVPIDSFAGQISRRLWGSGAWLLWRRPDETMPEPAVLTDADDNVSPLTATTDVSRGALALLTNRADEISQLMSDTDLGDKLSPLERGIVSCVVQSASPKDTALLPSDLTEMVAQLRVPLSVANQATTRLIAKLEVEGMAAFDAE